MGQPDDKSTTEAVDKTEEIEDTPETGGTAEDQAYLAEGSEPEREPVALEPQADVNRDTGVL